ncbi:hypothetical protein COCCADRAFT_40390 [Bipolaris zeicola 26-R-13]|uniref:Methyltransferase domain-containing protein n=1 Tax=Cochliobolus carbonum (strain 26-R-13) TaxID=930089 RepID=W6XVJ4_COCC2|nr:uncharacterized protein COCCADRAFT_40390 [Bipolaris zeicola 26-R-13]EUC29205.1 hypothetical protein COCCADRAFT_40390 [Bipolaris zeicola 26-R-13]
MTQPTTIDMTFDTSLVDVKPPTIDANTSFSTVESDQANTSTVQPRPQVPIHHIPTQDAYNQWASQYDSDGNMLQAIDDIELAAFLPTFLSQIPNPNPSISSSSSSESPLHILDLGCGTGRNTLKLLRHFTQTPAPSQSRTKIIGIDFSPAMLTIAHSKLSPYPPETWDLHCCDIFSSPPSSLPIPAVHAVLSTLVLEHIPLSNFFSTLSSLLLPSGVALITNMHHEMGRLGGQAGFVSQQGVKVRGRSFLHKVDEVLEKAAESGFEVLGVREREVRRGDLDGGVVGGRGEKWVGVRVWMGVLVRRVG